MGMLPYRCGEEIMECLFVMLRHIQRIVGVCGDMCLTGRSVSMVGNETSVASVWK